MSPLPVDLRRATTVVTVVVAALCALTADVLASCASQGDRETSTVTVSAASSLTDAFTTIAAEFEQQHPGTEVRLNFDSSATLASQVIAGAPADVLATADTENMAEVAEAGLLAAEPVAFAENRLVIVTRPGNPDHVTGVADLAGLVADGEVVSLCASTAPCGRLATAALEAADVALPENRVTRQPNARSTLGAVSRGDAAAGLVYATDASSAAGQVALVDIAAATEVRTEYLIAPVGSPSPTGAAGDFVELVTSERGRAVLVGEGFG